VWKERESAVRVVKHLIKHNTNHGHTRENEEKMNQSSKILTLRNQTLARSSFSHSFNFAFAAFVCVLCLVFSPYYVNKKKKNS